jgi:hypothetical protein
MEPKFHYLIQNSHPEPELCSPWSHIPLSEDSPQYSYYPRIYVWVFQIVSFPRVSPPKPYIHLSSPLYVLHDPPISFFSIWSPEQYLAKSYSLCSFLNTPVASSLLGPNILLSIIFSNSLSLRSSLNVSYQVSQL